MSSIRSLRVRLLIVMVAVALAPVAILAIFVHRATTSAFDSYSAATTMENAQAVAEQAQALTGRTVVVNSIGGFVYSTAGSAAPEAGVVAASGGEAGPGVASTQDGPDTGSAKAGSIGGTLASGAESPLSFSLPETSRQTFTSRVTRATWIAVAAAAASAVVLAYLLSRQIVGPVTSLTSAALEMSRGNVDRRVVVRSKDEIGLLASSFNAMAESRSNLDRLRRNLVNDVAHELRSPISNLRGYLEMLRDGDLAPTGDVLALLHDESLVLNRLVTDLQDLALAEAGNLPLHLESAPAGLVAARALEGVKAIAERQEVELVCCDAGLQLVVSADTVRFGQVLRNLLTNAIAHTPPGGRVELRVIEDPERVRFLVSDTGGGIAPEHLPHIFDRFYRADPARTRSTGGAGLGLAIVKHLVQLHGGEVAVESTIGAGTTVTVAFPRAHTALSGRDASRTSSEHRGA